MIAAGDLRQAAAALRTSGDLKRAQELYEQAWDLEGAATVAQERGDRIALLRIALRGQDLSRLAALQDYFHTAPAAEQQLAAELYVKHRSYAAAAALRERLQDLAGARELYQRGGDFLSVARLDEQAGEWSAAAAAYELAAEAAGDDPAGQIQARTGRGRVLLRAGQPEEAVRQLQAAWRLLPPALGATGERDELDALLIEALLLLGEPAVTRPLLARYAARHPDERRVNLLELTPAEFVSRRSQHKAARGQNPPLLGRYRLLRLLGAGSMGRVYAAIDEWQRREVAVKLLPLASARGSSQSALYRRFCREAQVLYGLRHPNIINVHEFYPAAGVLVLEYLPGGALSEQPLPLPLPLLRRVLCEVVDALLVVHAAGVLHRDIKPQNLFVSPLGSAKLADFGAASLRELGLTQTEGLVGTLGYMSPEQLRGDALSFATDVYGLGVTAFELATGQLPYPGPDFIEQHLTSPLPLPHAIRPALPQPWSALISQLLAKSPAARCQNLEALRAALLALPVPELPDDSRRPDAEVSGVQALDPIPKKLAGDGLALAATPHSKLYLTTDARLGRPLVVEQFAPGLLQSEAGATHLRWLRSMAQQAGPGLQRIIRIDLESQPSAQVHYEAPGEVLQVAGSALPPSELSQLRRIVARIHAAGQVHGSILQAVSREAAQPLLVVSGFGPLGWAAAAPPRPSDDLDALSRLAAADSGGGA